MKLATALIGLALIGVLSPTARAQYKVLAYFNGKPEGPIEPGLIAQGRGGYLFTTAPDQSTDLEGVAFRVGTGGAVKVLHQFNTTDGRLPASGLTLGRDGRFYGTTYSGGANNAGTVFAMTQEGTLTTLHQFTGGDEGHPQAPPIQSLYGDLYGTTYGDSSHPGAVYKIDSFGTYTLLHTFTGQDGSNPLAALVQGADFWFYGATQSGGANGLGTIFRISSTGEFQSLFSFDWDYGAGPYQLIQANDGNFYGVAYYGGSYDQGVVFKMTPTFQVTVLHHFTGGSDGMQPLGGLLQASDGNLYGTTAEGGANGVGVLFRLTTSGTLTVLHNFKMSTGAGPVAMMQNTNGYLYGDTSGGGVFNGTIYSGVFFRYNLGLDPFVTFLDSYGRVGMTVQILGEGFTNESQVFFNGTRALLTRIEPNFIKAVVPPGATSGFITVTTNLGTLKSNKQFIVRP